MTQRVRPTAFLPLATLSLVSLLALATSLQAAPLQGVGDVAIRHDPRRSRGAEGLLESDRMSV